MVNTMTTFVRHNQTVLASVVVCVVLVVWGLGCHPTVRSPINPEQKVTRTELDLQVKTTADSIAAAYAELEKQEQVRQTILEAGLLFARGETVNLLGVATTLAGILGVGAIVDNRRKDAVIKSKSNALSTVLGANGNPMKA